MDTIAVIVAALVGVAGIAIGAIITSSKLFEKRIRKRVATLTAIGGLAGAVVVLIVGAFASSSSNEAGSEAGPPGGENGGPTSSPWSGPTYEEIAGSHRGSPVFSNPGGDAVPKGIPDSIPFGTRVPVGCVADNQSAMASVTAFYLIVGGTWDGLFAVSDTFANGDTLGDPNGTTRVDPRVPACPN
ncbi:hypothetical protein [Nocardioides pocheonensis]|uniref:hypothetical protein n=1 Tax=Nocardioides pocheonensis TaxID=661485 RepID=UPI0011CE6237|nr:hypothetical protein [Nocardioides pocheonensis]